MQALFECHMVDRIDQNTLPPRETGKYCIHKGESGAVYVRWGNASCPTGQGTELLYSGRGAGSRSDHTGGGVTISVCQMILITCSMQVESTIYMEWNTGLITLNHYGVSMNPMFPVLCVMSQGFPGCPLAP